MVELIRRVVLLSAVVLFSTLPLRLTSAEVLEGIEAGPIGLEALPGHARAVVLAFAGRVRDGDPNLVSQGLAVGNSEIIKPEKSFRYRGFGLREVVLVEMTQSAGDLSKFHIAGHLFWKDTVGRRAVMSFEAFYRVADGSVALEQAAWEPKFSIMPRVLAFAVPLSAAEALTEAAEGGFASFLLAAAAAATKEASEDSVVAVFFMDRVGPDTYCELKLSKDRRGDDGEDEIARVRQFEPGWGVLGTSVTAAAFNADTPLWLKVLCGEKEGGLFSSPQRDVVGAFPISGKL